VKYAKKRFHGHAKAVFALILKTQTSTFGRIEPPVDKQVIGGFRTMGMLGSLEGAVRSSKA
jgi:hypothetical protein